MNKKAFVALLALVLAPPASHAQNVNSPEPASDVKVARLLSDARDLAALLKNDIATLDFLALSEGGWQTHASMLNLYQQQINDCRNLTGQLEAMRKKGSRWQQAAVDHIIPLMQELTAISEAALRASRTDQSRLNSADSKEYFKLNSDLASEIDAIIAGWADYPKTREDLDRLAQKTAKIP